MTTPPPTSRTGVSRGWTAVPGLRYYKPGLARWANRDPVGESGGDNLHAFVTNAPTVFHDPIGQALALTLNLSSLVVAGPRAQHDQVTVAVGSLALKRIAVVELAVFLAGDIADVTDWAYVTARGGSDCDPSPGGELEALGRAMHAVCDLGRACSAEHDTCESALSKLAINYACVEKRRHIMRKCFRGGDDVHWRVVADVRATLAECSRVASCLCSTP